MPSTPRARLHRLVFAHGPQPLLQGLDFDIAPGLNLVLGGDGRGKTTLLRLIAGELHPSAGRVQRAADTLSFEQPADPAHDAVVAADWLSARQTRFPGWRPELAAALVEAFGLAEHMAKPMHMLSTGSRRKVGLVAAAASDAALTLLDCPWDALDARSGRVLGELLAEAAEDTDRAWVVATHALPAGLEDARLAGRVDLGE
jgi:ABC-type multidrug transport system ATPase subunit